MKKIIAVAVALLIILSALLIYKIDEIEKDEIESDEQLEVNRDIITIEYSFSDPEIEIYDNYSYVYVDEADFYDIHDGWPTIPVKTITYTFPFGTKIKDVIYEYSEPEVITLSEKISVGSCSGATGENLDVYEESDRFPSNFVSYTKGGGLSDGELKTFLTVRVNPITYRPADDEIDFIKEATIQIVYDEPDEPLIKNNNQFDLLILTVSSFEGGLEPLMNHKVKKGIKTKIVTLDEIEDMKGRDTQEKMKYYIKWAIENWGIEYVLLVGGIDGQSARWNLPIRYSHVLIGDGKQETPEPEFISDLYFADIYDSEGNFSSWDTNENDIFAEQEGQEKIDEMDLYPDVYLGRLPCRTTKEVGILVNKIIQYENNKPDDEWFKRIIMAAGDHWPDSDQINEGALIMEEAGKIMSGFEPVELIATGSNKLLVKDFNKAISGGAGFAYFCGHGSPTMWGIHYPPDATGWGPSLGKLGIFGLYKNVHMNFLRNKNKLPIFVVGGCNNGQFDISWGMSKQNGKLKLLQTMCWAWKLTSLKNGGAIATIANTGLGTHAMGDADNDNVNDYLETLDGWMELRFFQLYSYENVDTLGNLHGETIKDYLHTFLNSNDEMDIKMVQQWELFGDPTLKVGGY